MPRRKITISVSAEIAAAAERLKRKTGESRSAVFERGVAALLSAEHQAERSRQYVAGYRRTPERRRDLAVALSTAVTSLAGEPWDEAR